jgi:hypothetical protein
MAKHMSITKNITALFIFFYVSGATQNHIQLLTEQKGVSIRALAIPAYNIIWASGSKGSIAKSIDAGKTFAWTKVKGYEHRDFRGIHAWDQNEAIIIAIAAPALILKTKDGGVNWYKVYENADTAMFLDAIQFKDDYKGVVIGDPIRQKIFRLQTLDRGESWQQSDSGYFKNSLKEGESFFASSNSNVCFDYQNEYLVSGGKQSRLWVNGIAKDLPIVQGSASTGANSIAISPNQKHLAIVGGDFAKEENNKDGFVRFDRYIVPNSEHKHLAIKQYQWLINRKVTQFNRYASSIVYLNNHSLIACGTKGVYYSKNGGKIWKQVSSEGFHVAKKIPHFNSLILAGSGGRIAIIHVP